jgi:hypothetical protein
MSFSVDAPNSFRISGFTMVGVAADPGIYNKGHIVLAGTSKSFRVDHITAIPITVFIRARGDLWGVVDHVTNTGNSGLIMVEHDAWGGSRYGDGSWAEQLYLGTEKAIYVEDCIMNPSANTFAGIHDAVSGARTVLRYNVLTRTAVGAHGADSTQRSRGVRSMEIYNNTFTWNVGDSPDFVAWFRGGTGVMFNNSIIAPSGLNFVAKHTNLRDSGSFTPWGQCNGASVYDQNQAGQTGYRCVDQPGSGTSNNLDGASTPPPQAVGNISDPIYVWNNTINGAANNCGLSGFGCNSDGHIVAGRDIIFGSARPGYTPYRYPHPLVTGSGTASSPPTALQVK